jgi:hypothetical protein
MRRASARPIGVDAIDTYLRRYPDSPIVLDVLGTLDAGEIRAHVHELDPHAEEVFFVAVSVGALFGVLRADGTRVAMKIHKLFTDEAYFEQVQRVQAALRAAGFPAPRPLGRRGPVTWEEWIDEGSFRDAHEPDVRSAMARELARFHVVATATGLRPRRPVLRPAKALWPKPHNVLFDFDATAAGAEWIDEIARAARRVHPVGSQAIGHTDWSAKHLRFDDALQVTALYDWDSMTTDLEPVLVGTAAGSFTYTEELEHPIDVWPAAQESLSFIEEYEGERGECFTQAERHTAQAACVYLRAYAARCQHAFAGDAHDSGLGEFADALVRDMFAGNPE